MKIDRKIVFIFFFLFAIIICKSLNPLSLFNSELTTIEYLEAPNNIEVENPSHADFCDDDEILSQNFRISFTNPENQTSPIMEYFLRQKTLINIWQPPKI